MLHHWPRIVAITALIEQIVLDGPRPEVIALLAEIASMRIYVSERARTLLAKTAIPGPDLLTPQQAAADLKLNTETVRVLCRRGELRCIRIGRSVRIPRASLEQFKRSRVLVGQSVTH